MSEPTGWDRRLSVVADGKGLVGHAGAVLLRRLADRTGLTAALAAVLPAGTGAGWRHRAAVVVQLAVAIALGAVNLSDAEQVQIHHQGLFGPPVSDSTTRRALAAMDSEVLAKIGQVRARVRRHVWSLLCLRPGGFAWLTIAGKVLHRWIVIDMDATIITAASKKQGAAATWKKTYGFHPLAAWCANTGECLAMTATNISRMTRIAGSHQIQWLDALHRHHAVVEDHVRTNKAMGLHNLPSKSWQINEAWMLTANLAADLDAWLRLLTLHDHGELADAEPDTMRFRLYHLPAHLARHARRRWLRIETTWPWADAFATSWRRLGTLPAAT
ncbi:transposase [Streptomyces sp. NPDC051133]|uniref:transposase n=1 Tax=Streptomyces sp. NPDC051133 TaxID=3155521 RepID=UPI00342E1BDE